jgi:hypothetical protein
MIDHGHANEQRMSSKDLQPVSLYQSHIEEELQAFPRVDNPGEYTKAPAICNSLATIPLPDRNKTQHQEILDTLTTTRTVKTIGEALRQAQKEVLEAFERVMGVRRFMNYCVGLPCPWK